jgi:D-alanyl-D-alanine carboxypeptidase/D-alanyl-D-alanine-endopeptidase (penicillin-binding protein 4)
VRFKTDTTIRTFKVERDKCENVFHVTEGPENYKEQSVPFIVNGIQSSLELLKDTIGKQVLISNNFRVPVPQPAVIWSQPADSLLRPMMYRSDNFFAEQLLLMVSAEKLGIMSDALIIDSILRSDLATLTPRPVWVDGSGLSRYNLFTPHNFIGILDRMQNEFGMDRIKAVFPTGDSGTLKGYYLKDNGNIYAKTGSMSGVLALSGYLYTKKNKLLLFSVLINNYNGVFSVARRKLEKFLQEVRNSN